MRNDTFLLVIGLLVFSVPFLGVPESWKAIFLFSLGVLIVISASIQRLANRKAEREESELLYEERAPTFEQLEVVE